MVLVLQYSIYTYSWILQKILKAIFNLAWMLLILHIIQWQTFKYYKTVKFKSKTLFSYKESNVNYYAPKINILFKIWSYNKRKISLNLQFDPYIHSKINIVHIYTFIYTMTWCWDLSSKVKPK